MNAKFRALAVIPAVALMFSLAACSGSDSKDDAKDTAATASAPADAGAAEGGAAGGEAGEKDEAGEKKEPPLTGAIKEKAEKAAVAAHPGTVLKSEEDQENPGLYAVEVRKSDGTAIEVYLDKSFKVVKTKEEGTEENEG
ncbi:PepSY domain-containing protein [Streptomyces sp. GMR22]|uniref:PepSY domain-containing protein n=1 Tax=Streptomyces sp. GMR22 TaxID=2759524 RepID=UPI0015F9D14E|nr:peptidase [Streptomyces sp. GMR22]MBA6434761.1 peptidase [Streptomyces sp. GMR22]